MAEPFAPALGNGALATAEMELRHLRASQERAVGEALRTAWEAEARERRATEARLEALQCGWPLLREWLMRLTSATRRWHEELYSNSPGWALVGAAVPPPPAESAWCREQLLPEAAKELCDCLEAIAVEGRRRLADGLGAPGLQQPPFAPRRALPAGAAAVPSLSPSPSLHGRLLHLSA